MVTIKSETRLNNGMTVYSLSNDETSIIYEQIQEYFKHGIEIHEGDTVFDVGANIGMFSLWVNQRCKGNVNIYAFEPIPAIFDVLQANVQRFGADNIKVLPYGLSNEAKTVTFAYHPHAPALSTAYSEDVADDKIQFKQAVLRNLKDAPRAVQKLRWVPSFLRPLVIDYQLNSLFKNYQVNCQLKTVSEVIGEYGISQIDLLKVDVEKSEMDVLLGIQESDWTKIKQIVVEVHDIDQRLDHIMALLKRHGFNRITVEQEPLFKASNIFNIYALC